MGHNELFGVPQVNPTPNNQTPSVGRIVHYMAMGSADGSYPSVCRAAIITEVDPKLNPEDPWKVGLMVANPTGLFFNQHVAEDETTKKPGTWHWVEYVK